MASEKGHVAAKVDQDAKSELEERAYNLSSPDRRVTVSDLVRYALHETYGIVPQTEIRYCMEKSDSKEPSGGSDGSENCIPSGSNSADQGGLNSTPDGENESHGGGGGGSK